MGPEPEFLHLTTTGRRTGLPREIEIWFIARGGRYYVIAERRTRAQWVRNLVADPRVRVRVGARRLAAQARIVGDATVLARAVRRRSEARYGWGDGLVVELTPVARPAPAARRPGATGRRARQPARRARRRRS